MMKSKSHLPLLWLSSAAVSLALLPAINAQSATARPASDKATQTVAPKTAAAPSDASATPIPARAKSYFHAAMAGIYEEEAIDSGRPEYISHAIEEYKNALNADPDSDELNNALADLYFRVGKISDAEATARGLLKTAPNNVDAHKLLGRIYLRQISDSQNAVSSTSPSGNALDLAIGEFEKIVALQPQSVEDHMVLGQLYTVKHQTKKAEEQFKIAQSINPDSEEVVLNLARLYAENGDIAHAAQIIEDVPAPNRTSRMEFALGAAYDQMKQSKKAIAAYERAADLEPGDARTMSALAHALLNDNQLDEALKQYQDLAKADPGNSDALIRISEIQRRQGKYEDALATIDKAIKIDPDSLEAGYNKGLLLDVLGRYDQAVATYQHMLDLTSHANGAYTADEKNNRGIFLDRLASVYHEQNKVDLAIATYQKMIDLGGDTALRGYQGEVDTYRDAKMFDKAIDVTQKVMLAGELTDAGKVDQGLAMAKGLLDNSAHDREIYLGLAQIYTRLRRWKDAEDALNKAEPLTTKKDDRVYLLFLRGALADRQKHMEPA
jgi:tetratricopeptide (TPR) repeat protein